MGIVRSEDILAHGDVEKAVAARRKEAENELKETGSLPDWWDLGVSLGKRQGNHSKFVSPDEYYSRGFEYFEKCAERGITPLKSGLILYLGFSGSPAFMNHARRNIAYREAQATLLTMLQLPLEKGISEPGSQTGKIFLLKNLPEGLTPETSANAPLEYSWKDKQTTELTGADGGPLEVSKKLSPHEAYMQMLGGAKMSPEAEAAAEAVVSGIPADPQESSEFPVDPQASSSTEDPQASSASARSPTRPLPEMVSDYIQNHSPRLDPTASGKDKKPGQTPGLARPNYLSYEHQLTPEEHERLMAWRAEGEARADEISEGEAGVSEK